MKTFPQFALRLPAPVLVQVFACVATLAFSAVGRAAPADSAPAPTHTLFMGTDISIQLDKKLWPIKDVNGSNFVVNVNGVLRLVPMRGETHSLNVAQTLKVTAVSANISAFTSARSYTPGHDPRMLRQRAETTVNAVIGDNASLAMGQFIAGRNQFGAAVDSGPTAPRGSDISAAALTASGNAAAATAITSQQLAYAQMESDLTSSNFARQRAEADLAKELYDAVEVTFKVSAAHALSKPWVAIVTRFHEANAKPGSFRNAIYARALETVGPRPQEVNLLQGGFPNGFTIDECQVHLYDRGQEIPTEIAPKRVELTSDEAFEYLKIEYLAQHKTGTLAASPALGKLREPLAASLKDPQLSAVYFVKVSAEGLPGDAFADEACATAVDPTIATAVATVRFFPALDKGKCVPGVARLVFSQLTL